MDNGCSEGVSGEGAELSVKGTDWGSKGVSDYDVCHRVLLCGVFDDRMGFMVLILGEGCEIFNFFFRLYFFRGGEDNFIGFFP